MCVFLKDYLPAMITGAFTFSGVIVGLVFATRNIARQIKSSYDLQQQQIDFQQYQARKALLREKAELLHATLLRIDELSAEARKISPKPEEQSTIPKYEAVIAELYKEVFGCISLIEIYFPELRNSENYNKTDIFMRHGAIQNLVSTLRHYDAYKKGRLIHIPENKETFEEGLVQQLLRYVSEMQTYLTKSNITNLMEELRELISAKYV